VTDLKVRSGDDSDVVHLIHRSLFRRPNVLSVLLPEHVSYFDRSSSPPSSAATTPSKQRARNYTLSTLTSPLTEAICRAEAILSLAKGRTASGRFRSSTLDSHQEHSDDIVRADEYRNPGRAFLSFASTQEQGEWLALFHSTWVDTKRASRTQRRLVIKVLDIQERTSTSFPKLPGQTIVHQIMESKSNTSNGMSGRSSPAGLKKPKPTYLPGWAANDVLCIEL
jgi:hypothetical protein